MRQSARRGATMLLLATTFAGSACGRNKPGQAGVRSAQIIFTNESLAQADVFAVVPGVQARRVGTVFPGRTETLTISGDLASRGDVRLSARILAGGTVGSGPIPLRPGDAIRVRLSFDQKVLVVLPDT